MSKDLRWGVLGTGRIAAVFELTISGEKGKLRMHTRFHHAQTITINRHDGEFQELSFEVASCSTRRWTASRMTTSWAISRACCLRAQPEVADAKASHLFDAWYGHAPPRTAEHAQRAGYG